MEVLIWRQNTKIINVATIPLAAYSCGRQESLRELAQDIRRLMMLVYLEERSKTADRLAKEYFIVALDDPKLEFQVREKEPQTLDSALQIAQRLEMFMNAVKQS